MQSKHPNKALILNIIVNIDKYHYLIVNSSKSIILSSINSKNEARQNALVKLQPILNNRIYFTESLLKNKKINRNSLEKFAKELK